jgi:ABC-type sugar transport system substrate-binding protein/AraC-like DNA-binding protein
MRLGIRVGTDDPFWVQIREALRRQADRAGVELIEVDVAPCIASSIDAQARLAELLAAQEVDALIAAFLPEALAQHLLAAGLPVIHLTETDVRHPLLTAPGGYYAAARLAGAFLAERLGGQGRLLAVGGLRAGHGEDGRSRLAGIADALRAWPGIELAHIPSAWRYERAYPQIAAALAGTRPPDAIFGLSDSLALAARAAAESHGLLGSSALVVGFNGDPRAIAAIAEGAMIATVDTGAEEFGAQAVDLACRAARGEPLPPAFGPPPRLVTADNVADAAVRKLIAIADLPSRLVGVDRRRERQRHIQFEISRAINALTGTIADRRRLAAEIVELIRAGFGFDAAQLHFWSTPDEALVVRLPSVRTRLPAARSPVVGAVVAGGKPVVITDTRGQQDDPAWPETRSRLALPVRAGRALHGVLDLHSRQATQRGEEELAGLQLLADQLGVALIYANMSSEVDGARAARASQPAELVGRAAAYIQEHHARDLSRQQIAAHIGVSESYLTQIFHRELGLAPWDYLHRCRIQRARQLLRATDESITAIAARVGFSDPAYFSRVFRKQEGVSPRAFRNRVEGA